MACKQTGEMRHLKIGCVKEIKNNEYRVGLTPDNVWARIMIDNGEMGFVRFKVIKQGRGDEIPFGSKIIE